MFPCSLWKPWHLAHNSHPKSQEHTVVTSMNPRARQPVWSWLITPCVLWFSHLWKTGRDNRLRLLELLWARIKWDPTGKTHAVNASHRVRAQKMETGDYQALSKSLSREQTMVCLVGTEYEYRGWETSGAVAGWGQVGHARVAICLFLILQDPNGAGDEDKGPPYIYTAICVS